MEIPPPSQLIRQTNERRPPALTPAQAAVISAEQWGYHEAHEKRMAELKARDDVKDSWLYRKTAAMDASSVAILRKGYADMFECENPQWKVNMEKHIAKARELEKESSKDGSTDGKDKDIGNTDGKDKDDA